MGEIGLYVHVPFCRRRCHYCDFNSYAGLERMVDRYVEALAGELTALPAGVTAGSLYFGGGTPSILTASQVGRLVERVRSGPGLRPDAEVTLEANPCDLDIALLRDLRAAGINRLSLGVQSLDDALLRRLGRRHDARQAREAVRMAREAGFSNLSLDLMFGLPNQDLSAWRETLGEAIALGPEHLSLYSLTIEPGTPFEKWSREGKLPLPDEDAAADMYEAAAEALAAAGYRHYEISNWARVEAGRDWRGHHNLRYWRNQPYLGLGAGAHSFCAGRRFSNLRRPEEYVRRLEAGESPVDEVEEIGVELEMSETAFLGLRLDEGIDRAEFRARFGVDPAEKYRAAIADLTAIGLIELDDHSLRLTPRGRLLGNEAFQRFLPSGSGAT